MPTKKRLFVGIAVAKPSGKSDLPGVYAVANRIADFARASSGYDDPILITDENGKVTSDLLVKTLTEDLLLDRPRIHVYFCGHGAFSDGIEIWYLSDGQNSWRERVDVAAFRDVLATYGPQQISIFSDACQTADTHPTRHSAILSEYQGNPAPPDYDVFRATIRGEAAFATPQDGPLFSKALAEALSSPPPASAVDELCLKAFRRSVVTNQSLKIYVKGNLPDYAAIVGQKQHPELMPGITYHTNDYLEVPPADAKAGVAQPEDFITFFETGARPDRNRSPEDIDAAVEDSRSEWRQPFWDFATQTADRLADTSRFLVGVSVLRTTEDTEDTKVQLDPDVKVQLHPADADVVLVPEGSVDGFAFFSMHFDGMQSQRAGVLQVDDLFIPLALGISRNLSLIVNVYFSRLETSDPSLDGPHLIGWHEAGFGPPPVARITPMVALKGFLEGYLGADTIAPIAAELHRRKHCDPLYGIVAAYLYDRAGDFDSIRRTCYFYGRHGQAVPFDIALLSRLPMNHIPEGGYTIDVPAIPSDPAAEAAGLPSYVWKSTEAIDRVPVSGVAPILRAGWARLRTLAPFSSRAFAEFSGDLTGAPFACVRGPAEGERLVGMTRKIFRHG